MTKNIYTIVNLIIIGIIIFLGVDTFYSVLETKLDRPDIERTAVNKDLRKTKKIKRQSLRRYENIILSRGIFGKVIDEKADEPAEKVPEKILQPTALRVSLVGTVSGSAAYAHALIEDKTKRSQDIYRVGDSIQGAFIKEILDEKVILSMNGKDEILTMDEPDSGKNSPGPLPDNTSSTPGESVSSRTITVKRDEIMKSLENLNEVMSQARIRPHFKNGNPDGIAITGVRSGSIFRKLGFINGDIINSVNGQRIDSPEDIISFYENLKSQDNLSLRINRRGRETELNYMLR